MLNFTAWDIVKALLLLPFMLIHITFLNINPVLRKKDAKIINAYYEFLDEEAREFIKFMDKGPIQLEKYKIRNSYPIDVHIECFYGSTEFDKQHRIAFRVERMEDKYSFGTGGRSALGTRSYKKDKMIEDFEKITQEIYRDIEKAWRRDKEEITGYYKVHDEWVDGFIKPILEKYDVGERNYYRDYYPIRRAHVLSMFESTHPRYIKAKEELVSYFKDEKKAIDFAKDIEDAYTSRIVMDSLS